MNDDPREEASSVAPVVRSAEEPQRIPDPGGDVFFRPAPQEVDAQLRDTSLDLFEWEDGTLARSSDSLIVPAAWPEITPQDLSVSAAQTVDGSYGSLAEPRTRLLTPGRIAGLGAIFCVTALVGGWIVFRPATLPVEDRSAQSAPPVAALIGRSAPPNPTPAASDSPPQLVAGASVVRPSAPPVTDAQGLASASSQAIARLPSERFLVSGPGASVPRPSLGPAGTSPRSAAEAASASIPDAPEPRPQPALADVGQPPIAEPAGPPAAAAPATAVAPVAPTVARGGATTSVTSAASATPAAVASLALAADEERIRTVLNRYRDAYGSLDVDAAHAVWPGVDARMLSRAFAQLSMQEFEFAACNISISGERASADCTGNARYVPKVGNKNPRVDTRVWQFGLRRIDQQWKIETVASR